MSTDVDVVIIGAGAAGIAAARRLATSGLSVTMLEASARVGGRAFTCNIGGLSIDLGCGWLHSADRNPWTRIAEASGFAIDRRTPAWRTQYRDLGFSPADQAAAARALADWSERLATTPPTSDCAADVLDAGEKWLPYLQAISGFSNGAALERISVADYLAYDTASTGRNWRLPAGYGTLISHSMPHNIDLRLSTPIEAIDLISGRVSVVTPRGSIRARRCWPETRSGYPARWIRGDKQPRACHSGATKNCSLKSSVIAPSPRKHTSSATHAITVPASTTFAPWEIP
jgi:monoamine oxidase